MDIQGTEIISAPREKVWEFVTDAESVASCTPGVKSVRILEPGKRFEVVGGVKLGTVGLNAKNVIEFTDLVELEEARMKIRGRGPGTTIDAVAELRLRDEESGTALDWKGTVAGAGNAGGARLPAAEAGDREGAARDVRRDEVQDRGLMAFQENKR